MFTPIKRKIKKIIAKTFYKLINTNFGFDAITRWLPETSVGTTNEINREKWLEKTLKAIPEGKKILDAGAGELKFKKYCSHLNYTSQDFGEYTGDNNGEGLQARNWDTSGVDIISDIIKIPVEDNSFDVIMCVEVFEHIPEPIKAIKEFNRILKLGGILILTAPVCSLTHYAPYYFYNGFSKYWHEKILKKFDFEILEIKPNGNYFEYLAQEIRRIGRVSKDSTNLGLKNEEKVGQFLTLKALSRFSEQDQNSDKLLCFGYLVKAVKK